MPPPPPTRSLFGLFVLVFALTGCATAPHQLATEVLEARAQSSGPRAAVATGLAQYQSAVDAGNRPLALAWLDETWRRRGALLDDRALLDVVETLPDDQLPESLASARDVQRILKKSDLVVRDHLQRIRMLRTIARGVPAPGNPGRDPAGWTQLRASIVAATLMEGLAAPGEGARVLQEAARIRVTGERGRSLRAVVQLQLAALAHRGEAYKEAIAGYLKVPMDSGYWREARLGLAWCQLRIGQPERTLKIIALLPGGFSGDPERAMLAAMAAHSIGHIDTARTILTEARDQARAWDPGTVTVDHIIAAVQRREDVPRLREGEETVAKLLAGQAAVRSATRELLATREELLKSGDAPVDEHMVALERRQLAALRGALGEASEVQTTRLKAALADLEVLLPQIQ